MNLMALDLSTHTGYAVFKNGKLDCYGLIEADKSRKFDAYPVGYIQHARYLSSCIMSLVHLHQIDTITIEETNQSNTNRYTQKMLEFIHFAVLQDCIYHLSSGSLIPKYLSSSEWRKAVSLNLTKEQREQNKELSENKNNYRLSLYGIWDGIVKQFNGVFSKSQEKKIREILISEEVALHRDDTGKITKKHLSVDRVNGILGTEFKLKDNDICDAILLGLAFLKIKGEVLCHNL